MSTLQEIIRKQRMKSDPMFANLQFLERLDDLTKEKVSKLIKDEFEKMTDALKADFEKRVEDIIKEIPEIKNKLMKGDKGDPGYTPIKGKDYFDGMHGKTPKAGVDFFIRDGIDANPEDVVPLVLAKIPKAKEVKLDTPDEVVQKVNSAKEKVAQSSIAGLTEMLEKIKKAIRQSSFGSVSGGGGVTVTTPTGTVNGVNTTFTSSRKPKYLVVDGVAKFETTHYTFSSPTITITDGSPPVQYIRVLS